MRLRAVMTALAVLATLVVPAAGALPADRDGDVPHVLVWTGTYGFRHTSILDAQLAFLALTRETGAFTVELTENPLDLSARKLRDVDVLAWVNTTGKPPLRPEQREEVIRWAWCGGGTLAFHAAADSNYGWAEYAELIGAQFDSHPYTGRATMRVEDDTHPITAGWQGREAFDLDDEWYRWRTAKGVPGVALPRDLDEVDVLLSLDGSTVPDEIQDGAMPYEDDQPIAWTKTFRGGGRVYYNSMGHNGSTWRLPEFRTSIVNAVDWVSEQRPDLDCLDGDEPLPDPPGPPPADTDAVGEACALPQVAERRDWLWETSGPIRRLTPSGDEVALATGLPGGFAWGAQGYVLDLSEAAAASADITLTLELPTPLDDYDLSVTTPWGWYGSRAWLGATTEQVTIADAPHCAVLWAYADNALALTRQQPILRVDVDPRRP
jgi:type 1 glutamine amidotransferase